MPESSQLGTAPGLKLSTSRDGYTTYTYHRASHGHAELTLHFTQPRAFGRLGAWVIMILVTGVYLWRKRNGAEWRVTGMGTPSR